MNLRFKGKRNLEAEIKKSNMQLHGKTNTSVSVLSKPLFKKKDNSCSNPSAFLLSGNIAENWKVFRQRFKWYLAAIGTEEKNNEVKSSVFLHIMKTIIPYIQKYVLFPVLLQSGW